MTQGEAVKALSQERGAFEKAEAQLKVGRLLVPQYVGVAR